MLKFCVLGSDISYTLSPRLHAAVFRELGVRATYTVEDIPPERLDAEIPRLRFTYDGFNITKPHKAAILPYLDAKRCRVNAVNTVVRDEKGGWTGYNTDIIGFAGDLKALAGDVCGMLTLLVGAGGAAAAVAEALDAAGADLYIYNRTPAKAEALAREYRAKFAPDLRGIAPRLIVNAASVGNVSPLPETADLSELRYAYDLVYSPPRSAFLRECELAGARTRNGLGMLIRQAIAADGFFLDRDMDTERLAELLAHEIKEEQ